MMRYWNLVRLQHSSVWAGGVTNLKEIKTKFSELTAEEKAALTLVNQGDYTEARNKLQHSSLGKTDG